MQASNATIEQAERQVQAEVEARIAAIRDSLAGKSGRHVCACGAAIGAARRKALPHAVTCIDCARVLERRRGGRRG